MRKIEYPPGWDEQRIRAVIDHYDRQSEDEAVAEYSGRYRQVISDDELTSEVAEASREYDADDPRRPDDES